MGRTKWNNELVKQELKPLGYFVGDIGFVKSGVKFNLYDIDGYYYFSVLHKVFTRNLLKFHKSNPYTIQNIKLWCKLNNKPFELISDTYKENKTELKWKCLKDSCGEVFVASWDSIGSGCGCPFCAGHQVGLSNCLATKRPDLALEWHPTLNGELTPYDVTLGCSKEVWWQCRTNVKHIWKSKMYNRNKGDDCPYCSGKYPSDDYNLLFLNPKLCEEWNYKRNKNKPEEYCPNSGKLVWWKCKECGFEWRTTIDNRNKGTNCPECNESKGEKRVKECLNKNNIKCISQKIFDELLGIGGKNLSYDFYLPEHNFLIEYQGVQHEKYTHGLHKSEKDFFKQQEHDRRKRDYATKNNIKLLEIWYWDFDNIEQILNKELFKEEF